MLYKPWEVVGADILTINNKLLFIVDYYSKFPVAKNTDRHLTDNLITAVKIVVAEFELPKKIVLEAGANFM